MTPEQLRRRAWKNIESARKLVDSDPDQAAQIAGYAAELALKARFCTRRGWADFPESRSVAKQRGVPERLFTHDLEELLKYTDDVSIKTTTMHRVDWDRASDWSVDQRYTPVGSLNQERAAEQINETEKLFIELVLWEILEKVRQVEIDQAKTRGPFNFFGLVADKEMGKWAIWFAAWGTAEGVKHRFAATVNAARTVLDNDLFDTVAFRSLHPQTPVIRAFYALLPPIEHHRRAITSHNFSIGIFLPSAYVVTCVNRDPSVVEETVKVLSQHEQSAELPDQAAPSGQASFPTPPLGA